MATTLHQRTLPVHQSTVARLKNNAFFYRRQLSQFTFHPLLQTPLLFMMVATAISTSIVLWRLVSLHRADLPDPVFLYPLFFDQQQQFIPVSWLIPLFVAKNIPALIALWAGYRLSQREQAYLSNFLFVCVTISDLLLSLVLLVYLQRLIP